MTRSMMRAVAVVVLVLTGAVALAAAAQAQGFPGARGGGGGNRGSRGNAEGDQAAAMRRNAAAVAPVDTAIALERELSTLRNDLLLDVRQTDAWMAFEHSVRDAAQAARARQARISAQRQDSMIGGLDPAPGAAAAALKDLADDERNRGELVAEIARTTAALEARIDPRQTGIIERRIAQVLHDSGAN